MFIGYIISGVSRGCLYSLLGLSFGLVYSTTGVFHIALGSIFIAAGYFIFTAIHILGMNTLLAIIIGLILASFLGLLIELLIYRPLSNRDANWNIYFVSSLGAYIFFTNLAAVLFGNSSKVLRPGPGMISSFGKITMSRIQILQVIILVLVVLILFIFLTKHKDGLAIRALKDNDRLSIVLGIDSNRTRTLIFLLSSGVCAISGSLNAFDIGVQPNSGLDPILSGAIAVMIVGRKNIFGAVFGGLILGMVQSFTVMLWAAKWQQVATFVILALVLFFRKDNLLFSKKIVED